jgi:hypothetical protein
MSASAITAMGLQPRPSVNRQKMGPRFCLSKPGDPDPRNHLKLWIVLVAFLTLGQIAAIVLVPRSLPLTLINDAIQSLLMLSAVLVFMANASAGTRQTRPFWMLLAGSWGVRIVVQAMWMYFNVVLRKEAPNPFAGDILLFLSSHYCPAKISEGHPNPLKISMITHGQSENDFN